MPENDFAAARLQRTVFWYFFTVEVRNEMVVSAGCGVLATLPSPFYFIFKLIRIYEICFIYLFR